MIVSRAARARGAGEYVITPVSAAQWSAATAPNHHAYAAHRPPKATAGSNHATYQTLTEGRVHSVAVTMRHTEAIGAPRAIRTDVTMTTTATATARSICSSLPHEYAASIEPCQPGATAESTKPLAVSGVNTSHNGDRPSVAL